MDITQCGIYVTVSERSRWTRIEEVHIQLQQVFKAGRAQVSAAGQLRDDIHYAREHVSTFVGYQSGRCKVLHLRNLMMQFDKASCHVLASNSNKRVFHNRAQGRLLTC